MILQPIVENAYIHGRIFTFPEACISISVRREGGMIRFQVIDNGKGIDPDTLALIHKGEKAGKGNGFGLMNIRERLALYFGGAGILVIESAPEQGTAVTITLPACTEKPELYREG
ncbi:Sensor histidine kinase YpdA [compost metagenome]